MIVLHKNENFEVLAATTLSDLYSVKADWERIAWHPSIDPEMKIAELEEANKNISPCIMLVGKENLIVGLLIAMIKSIRVDLKLKYFTILKTPC